MSQAPSPPRTRLFLWTAAASALALLVLELGLSALPLPPPPAPQAFYGLPPEMEADPVLVWRLKPGEQVHDPVRRDWEARHGIASDATGEVPISREGFRDTDLATPRPEGQRRILCLGDSSVYGSGAPWLLGFPQRLELMLNPPGLAAQQPRPVEVINAGVAGYSSFQSAEALERALPLGLDGVIIYTMNSDRMTVRGVPDARWFESTSRQVARPLLSRLALFSWARWVLGRAGALSTPPQARPRVTVGELRANLTRMVESAREAGLQKIVFVVPPLPPEPDGALPPSLDDARAELETWRARVEAWEAQSPPVQLPVPFQTTMVVTAAELGVDLVDGPRVFAAALRQDPSRYQGENALFVDLVHPSAEGHRLLAEALLPHLSALGSPSPTSGR